MGVLDAILSTYIFRLLGMVVGCVYRDINHDLYTERCISPTEMTIRGIERWKR